jgi:hypothetical protein
LETFADDLESVGARPFWVASMNDITLYARERHRARLAYEWHRGDETTLSLEIDDGLPDEIYSAPLTVSFRLPIAWRAATLAVDRNGRRVGTLRTEIDQVRGLWDVLPDAARWTIRKVGDGE